MRECLIVLIVILLKCNGDLYSPPKQTIVVGGYVVGNADILRQKWSLIFETYLTETVGTLYSPPINFLLIPVDFTAETTSPKLLKDGQLDFICMVHYSSFL